MKIGYARISTADQNLDLQEDVLKAAGCEKIFREMASDVKDERKGLADAIKFARAGDILIVWKLDRLGRTLKHLIGIVNRLGLMSEPNKLTSNRSPLLFLVASDKIRRINLIG